VRPSGQPFTLKHGTAVGFGLLLLMLMLVAGGKPIISDGVDPDMFWHLRVGEQLWQQGVGPIVDRMSYSAIDRAWTPYSWLAELFMLATWNAGGYRLTLIVDALCSGLTVGFIALACVEATRRVHTAPRFLASLLAVFGAVYLAIAFQSFRPVTFALLFISAAVWLMWRDRRIGQSKAVWCVPVLVLVVTNLHLYVLPMGMLIASLVRWNRRGIVLLGLCALAAMCTPMLSGVVMTSIVYASADPMVAAGKIAEMKPMGMIDAIVAGAIILWCAARWREVGVLPIVSAMVCLGLSMWLGRFQTVLAISMMPLVAVQLGFLKDGVLEKPVIRIAGVSMAVLMVARIVTSFPGSQTSMSQWANRFVSDDQIEVGAVPELAAEFVEATVPPRHGKVITEFTDGGFVGWRLPEFQVFMDGRTNVHPAEFWKDVYLSDERALVSRLRQSPADAAILPRQRSRLRGALESMGWRVAFEEPSAVVMLPE
jgi:hypothetical protein